MLNNVDSLFNPNFQNGLDSILDTKTSNMLEHQNVIKVFVENFWKKHLPKILEGFHEVQTQEWRSEPTSFYSYIQLKWQGIRKSLIPN